MNKNFGQLIRFSILALLIGCIIFGVSVYKANFQLSSESIIELSKNKNRDLNELKIKIKNIKEKHKKSKIIKNVNGDLVEYLINNL